MMHNGRPVAISCRDVCMGYGGTRVLDQVNLDIPAGCFLPFIGPNGGGKTTLLRGILGLERLDCGEIEFARPELRLGYVPQQKSIDPLFPVPLEHIVMMGLYPSLGFWRRPSPAQKEAVRAALREVGLEEHAHKNYRELSGGMKQKGLIARALVSGADVLVLDEPTSDLDAPAERDIIGHLFRLSLEEQKTVLIACHGIQLAVAKAERVCLVEHGHARIVSSEEAARFTSVMVHSEDAEGAQSLPGRRHD